jgi:WD40 repeat protein/DNA-binding SARP family transcriptional activator/energy-coupling factor transporter ATP-binding protein EcfA2
MAKLAFSCFGRPRIRVNGRSFEIKTVKGLALLAYLAVEDGRASRDGLATLLWPDYDQVRARTNLRRQLYLLNQTPIAPWLEADPELIALRPDENDRIDIRRFAGLIDDGSPEALSEATALYKADFLAEFHVPDSAPFEEWAALQREHYRREVLDALDTLANHHLTQQAFKAAEVSARQQLEIDDLREPAWRQLMKALAGDGRRAEALAVYERCRQHLDETLQVEPSAETAALAEELRRDTGGAQIGEVQAPVLPPAARPAPSGQPSGSPYRGLFSFREEDAPYFFGREEFTDLLVSAVYQQAIVAVIGPSGSGKSSVVNAGLMPQIRPEDDWHVASFRPESRPFEALAESLLPLLEPELSQTDELVEGQKLAVALDRKEVQLFDVIHRILSKDYRRLLLFVDQFEELFTLCPDPEMRRRFLDVLLDPVFRQLYQPAPIFNLILTLRADFVGQALTYRPLADALQEADVKLGPMSRPELARVILNPASLLDVKFEAGLAARLLDDVGEEPGNLPLLQFALASLWEKRSGARLTHAAYEAIGMIEGALAQYAEEVFAQLDDEQKTIARHIFVQLVQPGEWTEDTRRLATRAELDDAWWPMVQHLADARLVVTGNDALGRETVEIVHEALIRNWFRLQDWLVEDRAFRVWQERLRVALRTWRDNQEDAGSLLRGAALETAEEWLDERPDSIGPEEAAFIAAGVEQRQERQAERARKQAERERLRRRVAWVLLAGLLTAVLLAAVAGRQWFEAQRNFSEAQRQRLSSESLNLLSAGASGELPALLALNSLAIGYSPEGQVALYRALANGFARHGLDAASQAVTLEFSPDGRYLLTGSDGDGLHLWDTTTGQEVRRFTDHQGPARGRFSPDGRQIVSAGDDGMIRLWETESGLETLSWAAHDDLANNATFSPDGRHILSVSDDQSAKLWDVATGTLVQTYGLPPLEGRQNFAGGTDNWVFGPAFAPDGRTFLTGSADLLVREWEIDGGEVRRTYRHESGIQVQTVIYSPDGRLILSVPLDNTAAIWEVESGERVQTLSLPPDVILIDAAFSPDGRAILTGSTDSLVRLWDLESGELIRTYIGHNDNVQWVAFSPDGRTIASAGEDGEVRLWDIQLETEPHILRGSAGRVSDLALAPDGRTLLTTEEEGEHVRVWDVASGEIRAQLPGHVAGTASLAFAPDGKKAVTAGWDNVVRIWDVESGTQLSRFQKQDGFITQIIFSPDSRLFLTGDSGGLVQLWDADTGEAIGSYAGHQAEIWSLELSPDGQMLLSGSWDGTARLWDLASGAELLALSEHDGAVTGALFMPNGDTILTTSDDQLARLWDRQNGELLRQFPLTAGQFSHVALSQDGRFLYLGGGDHIVRRYDVESGVEDGRFAGHSEVIFGVALSPDGSRLFTGSWDGTIRLWRTEINELIAFVCSQLPRDLTADERMTYALNDNEPTC